MRSRLALLAVPALALAGCGGGGHAAETTAATATTAGHASATAEVARAWRRFFDPGTTPAQKVKLLQDGSRFAPAIRAASRSPLAKQLSAKVLRVTRRTPTTADVVYTLALGGKPALVRQHGVAVRTNGVWQVGAATFCKLAAFEGATLTACTKMTP